MNLQCTKFALFLKIIRNTPLHYAMGRKWFHDFLYAEKEESFICSSFDDPLIGSIIEKSSEMNSFLVCFNSAEK